MEKNTRGLRDIVKRTALMGSLSFLLPLATIGFVYFGGERFFADPGAYRARRILACAAGPPPPAAPLAGITDHENNNSWPARQTSRRRRGLRRTGPDHESR